MKPKIKILQMEQPIAKVIGKRKYLLMENWNCLISINTVIITVTVNNGAVWDGASVPRFFWSLLGLYPGGRMLAPSLPHDGWCSGHSGNKPDWFTVGSSIIITPYIRDLIFRESCKHVGILKIQARAMWFCVVLYQKLQCRKYKIKYK